jgi:hypothetical protein
VLYAAQANHYSGGAIDSLTGGDLKGRDDQLGKARLSLAVARDRLDEAAQSDKLGDWTDAITGLGHAIDDASRVIEDVSNAGAGDNQQIRAELSDAETALTTLGPPSECVDPSYSTDSADPSAS